MKTSTIVIVILILVAIAGFFYFSGEEQTDSIMSPSQFEERLANNAGIIIDVRTPEEYADGHLKKVKHNFDVTSGEFEAQFDSLNKDETYYLYCRSGNRSGKAKKLMEENGFTNVYNVGGYQDLVDAGFESEK